MRESEQAESSRAAAVARAHQLIAQPEAFAIGDPSAGLLLLSSAVASAAPPQHGVSGDV